MSTLFKKATFSILALSITSSASYATLLPPNTVTNPNIKGVFIGIDGLYLQPTNNNLDYITIYPNGPGFVSTQSVSPDYTGGFNLYGGVTFGHNDDFTVDWAHLHSSDSNSAANILGAQTATPLWLFNSNWSIVTGNSEFDYDDVSAVLGHTYYFNNPWSVRFAAGAEYARIENDFNVTGIQSPGLGGTTFGYQQTSEFNGVGPRVEGDLFYRLPYNFGLFADSNAALLIGRRNLSLNSINPTDASYSFSNRNIVVPSLGIKLGVSYTFLFGSVHTVGVVGGEGAAATKTVTTPATAVNISGGWQANTLLNAVEHPNCIGFGGGGSGSGSGSENLPSSCSQLTNTVTDYSNQGVFLGIKVNTNGL